MKTMLRSCTSSMSHNVKYAFIGQGYLINAKETDNKVFCKLYQLPETDWYKLIIFKEYDFALDGNAVMQHKKDGTLRLNFFKKGLTVEMPITYCPDSVANYMANRIGFRW